MNLSPHFTLAELSVTEHRTLDNTPPPEVIPNLKRLAEFLERVRVLLGRPLIVTSAYRSSAVNAAVGSKPTSQHRLGCAADFRVPGMTPDQVVRAIRESGLPFDQLIREFDTWTHVSVPSTGGSTARKMSLIIDTQGARAFA